PQVLAWLTELAASEPKGRPLALRRSAEKRAREGDAPGARDLAEQARAAARELRDPGGEALALATLGSVLLYSAAFEEADGEVLEARARLAAVDIGDREEIARLDHNLGVVALYRGRIAEAVTAFERSLEANRRLGDRSGMRACLLNLGLALAKAGRFD